MSYYHPIFKSFITFTTRFQRYTPSIILPGVGSLFLTLPWLIQLSSSSSPSEWVSKQKSVKCGNKCLKKERDGVQSSGSRKSLQLRKEKLSSYLREKYSHVESGKWSAQFILYYLFFIFIESINPEHVWGNWDQGVIVPYLSITSKIVSLQGKMTKLCVMQIEL